MAWILLFLSAGVDYSPSSSGAGRWRGGGSRNARTSGALVDSSRYGDRMGRGNAVPDANR